MIRYASAIARLLTSLRYAPFYFFRRHIFRHFADSRAIDAAAFITYDSWRFHDASLLMLPIHIAADIIRFLLFYVIELLI